MQAIMLLCLIWNSGYGVGYDGCDDKQHYFHVSTPKADYGIVVSEKEIYCDVVSLK